MKGNVIISENHSPNSKGLSSEIVTLLLGIKHSTKFGNFKANESYDIKRSTLGLQTDRAICLKTFQSYKKHYTVSYFYNLTKLTKAK